MLSGIHREAGGHPVSVIASHPFAEVGIIGTIAELDMEGALGGVRQEGEVFVGARLIVIALEHIKVTSHSAVVVSAREELFASGILAADLHRVAVYR